MPKAQPLIEHDQHCILVFGLYYNANVTAATVEP